VLLGLSVGLSVAGPPSSGTYKAHFLQTYVSKNPVKKEVVVPVKEVKPSVVLRPVMKPVASPAAKPVPSLMQEIVPSSPVEIQKHEDITVAPKQPVFKAAPIEPEDTFPKLDKAIYPVSKSPNWGAMRTAAEWDRMYPEMYPSDFVDIPPYSSAALQTPLSTLTSDLTEEHIALITAKLFYSTRFFGRYSIDSGDFEGRHPGIDLKLAAGTPVYSIAGGMVHATGTDEMLGNYVMIEHHLPNGEAVVSIYGHLERIGTTEGAVVKPGTPIGTVGSTGASSGPHLHLQIDKKKSPGRHKVYAPDSAVSSDVASEWTLHPIEFIQQW